MHKLLIVPIIIISASPAVASATSVVSHAVASANSGGITAGSGGSVATGDNSASAHIQTVMNDSGGTSVVEVTTVSNGQTYTERKVQTHPAGTSVVVNVSTSSSSGGSGAIQTTSQKTKNAAKTSVTAVSASNNAAISAVALGSSSHSNSYKSAGIFSWGNAAAAYFGNLFITWYLFPFSWFK